MSEENKTDNQATENNEAKNPVMALQKVYLKDASFEAPNAPQIFQEQGQPQIQMNLNQKVTTIAENTYDVVLTVTVTCTVNDKTAYLVEVQQAGIFSLVNFPEQILQTCCSLLRASALRIWSCTVVSSPCCCSRSISISFTQNKCSARRKTPAAKPPSKPVLTQQLGHRVGHANGPGRHARYPVGAG